jgi:type II secretory pathway component PulF
MRIEYIVVSIVLMLVVLLVAITLLSGVVPGMQSVFDIFGSRG